MNILIDNGHGADTPGKQSPCGTLREYRYCRDIAREVVKRLKEAGVDAELLTPEDRDIALSVRVRRVNMKCREKGAANVALVSIHNNAAPPNDSQWHSARGWEAWTSKGQTRGDILAEALYNAARLQLPKETKIRCDFSDGDCDKEANFTILARTQCAACLTENLFQDNREDMAYLLSAEGRESIVKLHTEGILNFIKRCKS